MKLILKALNFNIGFFGLNTLTYDIKCFNEYGNSMNISLIKLLMVQLTTLTTQKTTKNQLLYCIFVNHTVVLYCSF